MSFLFKYVCILVFVNLNYFIDAKWSVHNKHHNEDLRYLIKRILKDNEGKLRVQLKFEYSTSKILFFIILVKETHPLSTVELYNFINKFPVLDDEDKICIQSEKCAKKWMDKYNSLLQKISEAGSFLEVNKLILKMDVP